MTEVGREDDWGEAGGDRSNAGEIPPRAMGRMAMVGESISFATAKNHRISPVVFMVLMGI